MNNHNYPFYLSFWSQVKLASLLEVINYKPHHIITNSCHFTVIEFKLSKMHYGFMLLFHFIRDYFGPLPIVYNHVMYVVNWAQWKCQRNDVLCRLGYPYAVRVAYSRAKWPTRRTDPSISQYGSDSSYHFYQVRHVVICPSHLRRCASRQKTDDGKFPFAAEDCRHVSVNGQWSDKASMSGGTLRSEIRSPSVARDEEPATCSLLPFRVALEPLVSPRERTTCGGVLITSEGIHQNQRHEDTTEIGDRRSMSIACGNTHSTRSSKKKQRILDIHTQTSRL